ncbi:hypothetical protein D8674_040323 [Pyrus ussuriensis x Pyrus communis]|uniref:RNase H type-1 domain-containing protein n=1 Tax=Pyrus ussuriensis x Pyrus communis TaxID=2448454 RepID=A0A5N5GZN1_9ROSA|nr:hypothetical protein D8674_040323 [Pyrus ussuriensis x Pyrus communis]
MPMRDLYPPTHLDWLAPIITTFPSNKLDLVFMIPWSLWGARNKNLWSGTCENPDVIVGRCLTWWQDFTLTRLAQYIPNSSPNICPKWSLPPPNTDSKLGGFGLIIRDASGSFVTTMAGHFMDTFSHLQAETLAFRSAVLWAISRGFLHIILKSD